MSECTTCTYYGLHLEGPAEDLPWPCCACDGGSHYIERGNRPHKMSRNDLEQENFRLAELLLAKRGEIVRMGDEYSEIQENFNSLVDGLCGLGERIYGEKHYNEDPKEHLLKIEEAFTLCQDQLKRFSGLHMLAVRQHDKLRAMEWSGTMSEGFFRVPCCPVCFRKWHEGHKDDCPRGALLAEGRKVLGYTS